MKPSGIEPAKSISAYVYVVYAVMSELCIAHTPALPQKVPLPSFKHEDTSFLGCCQVNWYDSSSARFLAMHPPSPTPRKLGKPRHYIGMYSSTDTLHLAPLQRPIHLGDPAICYTMASIASVSLKNATFFLHLAIHGRSQRCCPRGWV
jgi:hypothetical protein